MAGGWSNGRTAAFLQRTDTDVVLSEIHKRTETSTDDIFVAARVNNKYQAYITVGDLNQLCAECVGLFVLGSPFNYVDQCNRPVNE